MTSDRAFKFVTRLCPQCQHEFEALDFWDEDVTCGACSRKRYSANLAAVRAGRPYSIDSIGGACPTQATGRTADDRPYYFRARHGAWTLEVGKREWPTAYVHWPIRVLDRDLMVADGADPSNGFMEWAAVTAILDAHIG